MKMTVVRLFSVLISFFVISQAQAVLKIEITQGISSAMPIAVVPFGVSGMDQAPVDFAKIISANLHRSGRFKPLPEKDFLSHPVTASQVRFKEWRMLSAESLVVGNIRQVKNGYVVQFHLLDVYSGKRLLGYTIPARGKVLRVNELRYAAHQISDIIYKELTGKPGAFATQIAYVTSVLAADGKPRYSLFVADADGENPRAVLNSKWPVMSPSWSPNGERLAYVSFETERPVIYIQELLTGERKRLQSFKGLNGAPSWSPDGKQLAVVLSRDGNPEIYVYDLARDKLRRLTRNRAIDTEPVWSPDGDNIVFTSSRSGGAQLYQIPVTGGRPKRLTFEGNYNSRATFSADGKLLAMVHRERDKYYIAVKDLERGGVRLLSEGGLDESPSFSPNGSMIIYATKIRGKSVLAIVSVDGHVRQRLSQMGDVREPAWSAFKLN